MTMPTEIVIDNGCAGEVLPALSFTVTLNEEVPEVVGVPLITPVEAASDNPAGSVPLLTVQLL
jgi:hypothetical protein